MGDPIRKFQWSGSDGFFKPAGVAVLVLALVSWCGKVQASAWKKRHTAMAVQALNDRLGNLEHSWKMEQLQEAQRGDSAGLQLSVINQTSYSAPQPLLGTSRGGAN